MRETCPYFNECDTECVGIEDGYRFTCSVLIQNVKIKLRYKRIREDGKVVILEVNE
jgi:hypothetical protein